MTYSSLILYINIKHFVKRKHQPQYLARAMCLLTVYNKAQAQRISNREFKLWTFFSGTKSRVATFLAETCVRYHQSLIRQAKPKNESPTAVMFGS
jgi:hypothetical protein